MYNFDLKAAEREIVCVREGKRERDCVRDKERDIVYERKIVCERERDCV